MFEIIDELEPFPFISPIIEDSMRLYYGELYAVIFSYYVREFYIDTATKPESVETIGRIIGCSKSMTK